MLTVDASVWVGALDLSDSSHLDSRRFLAAVRDRGTPLIGPAILLVEAGCALARRMNDAGRALAAVDTLRKLPALTIHAHEPALDEEALKIGIDRRLRGADAFYAALAARENAPLITWDLELVERAGAQTPAQWLVNNAADSDTDTIATNGGSR